MGFTEAELGFFLALLFLGMMAAGPEQNPPYPELQARIDSLEQVLDSMSTISPDCNERGLERFPIPDTLEVLRPELYVLGGDTVSLSDFTERAASFTEDALANGCYHMIHVRYGPGVPANVASGFQRGEMMPIRFRIRTIY